MSIEVLYRKIESTDFESIPFLKQEIFKIEVYNPLYNLVIKFDLEFYGILSGTYICVFIYIYIYICIYTFDIYI
jgi:hypothetical protein